MISYKTSVYSVLTAVMTKFESI